MSVINNIKSYISGVHNNNKAKALKFILAVPTWIILIAVFLIVFGVIRNSIIYSRPENDMASYWEQGSEMTYRHMVAFARGVRAEGIDSPPLYASSDISLHKLDIPLIRTELQNVVDASRGDKKNGGLDTDGSPRYWEDCYSCDFNSEATLTDDSGNTINRSQANVVAVGGNYRVFHPFMYMSGGFLTENCVDMDQVVINDVLAWKFFKSYDVVGNKFFLLGHEFTVCGVVRESSTSLDETAKAVEPRCYIYFSALENYYKAPSTDEEGSTAPVDIAITCYEAMLPELVVGVAVNDFKNALPTYTENNPQLYVVSYTGRLGLLKIWDYMMPIGESNEKLAQYSFPYWERVEQVKIQNVFVNVITIIIGIILLLIGIVMVILKVRKAKIQSK